MPKSSENASLGDLSRLCVLKPVFIGIKFGVLKLIALAGQNVAPERKALERRQILPYRSLKARRRVPRWTVLDAATRDLSEPAETAIMRQRIPTTAPSRAAAARAAPSVVGTLAHFALDAVRVANTH